MKTSTTNNAILIYIAKGKATYRFCPEDEARTHLDIAKKLGDPASMMVTDDLDCKFVLSVSPNLRDRVEQNISRMQVDYNFIVALDKHGVPKDRELRCSISKAFADLVGGRNG
jgi:hypothetical protein